ncbi:MULTISPECIES: serine/threonine-protein kinase [Mycobacterium avium complex (MAC)]|uniref:non-specific serine/threonine protein kinase n=2 Tax=Mycobacterium intracellulare TaxID=1767 RepID=A0AAE4U3Q8_MYCIT|nr:MULTISPECIES: serine/threonine-protein kinase [Mycobacterium avium complex (MAC)]AFS14998.1 Serine/threonine-protein kinase pknF [Mycobacterium intracellulare subsp. intracellulare MTCC 9506]MCA2319398.1 serine/threonine protein kinase [Mycobacterium intracellulare]MCA2339910.1 serine/threonine protein kinase [Mycobacterium intracellulare]MDV6976521.1 serine/threonine-protein kinase [Mycobacterium intracellulare]MDV6982955.1 serine/threonine-protein kinase [Mycobacterium intracellulare]
MDEHKRPTRRIGTGRRLLTNPRQARDALRAGFHSLPAMPIGQLFRRIPPVSSVPNAEPQAAQPHSDSGAVGNGASFAGYTILRQLGAGGMAEVYLALHPRLPRRDVIKVLAEAVTADPEFRERFNREADLAATLWHPHIVGVHDRGAFNGHLWISMDYVEGTDASRLVKESHPEGMPIHEVCAIVQAVAGALDYAHDRGLLHRDVKPANILLTHPEDGERRILLADFGVARHLGDVSGITETNVAVGTVAYAAPEQLAGAPIDGRADQYALAATAFHLLTGAPPFQHSNPIAVISRHLHETPPRLSDFRPELAELDDVFSTALAKRPEDRFARCREFATAVSVRVSEARRPAPRTAPLVPPRRRGLAAVNHRFSSKTRWAAALVCAVLVAVAATWSILYSFEPTTPPPSPALASKPSVPAASAAPAAGGPALNGTYRLDYDQTKRTTNGIGIRHGGATTDWWAFRSACTTNGCAATGTQLDDATHQLASTTGGGQADTLRYVGGYWQGAPEQLRVGCAQPNGHAPATQQETVAWSLAPQADGTLRGTQTETVLSNECGAQGAVVRVPVVATRAGAAPAGVALGDPTQVINASTTASAPAPPVLGGLCADVGKVAYDPTNNEQIVCEGSSWAKAPITMGVHAAGSSCDRPGTSVFAMSTSSDGYLLQCDPVTRTWTRPAG